jgi:hypothetical protein
MINEELQSQLLAHQIEQFDEISLRETLEAHAETYTLMKLAPWPARRCKCHYRLMMSTNMYDAQTAAEAYAMGLLALLQQKTSEI